MCAARSLTRKVGTRSARKKIILYCEGTNTEPGYFKAYAQFQKSSVVELVFAETGAVPVTLCKKAIDKKREIGTRGYKKENGDRDEVWVVFDRDTHNLVDAAIAECNAAGVGVAFSDPCFEVWLILHFSEYNKDEDGHDTQRFCEIVCPGYSRNGKGARKTADWQALLPNVAIAEGRAIALEARRAREGGRAPSTSAYKLTTAIRTP